MAAGIMLHCALCVRCAMWILQVPLGFSLSVQCSIHSGAVLMWMSLTAILLHVSFLVLTCVQVHKYLWSETLNKLIFLTACFLM